MGFEMWGWMHIVFIISPFLLTTILVLTTYKAQYKTKRIVGIILAVIMILLLLARNIEIMVKNGGHLEPEVIPLQICHFANFVILFAFIFNNQTLHGLSFCLNLPAALMSIIFANSLTNYSSWSVRGVVYLLGHMLIVGTILWAFLVDMIKIRPKTFLKTIILMVAIYVISIPINNLLNMAFYPEHFANYFYSLKPEEGTPLGLFFDLGTNYQSSTSVWQINPVYLLLTATLGAIVVSAFYGLYTAYYLVRNKIVSKKSAE